jgi:hypothetical protein
MSEPPTREQVLVLYAEAMHAAQDLEEAIVGLIGTHREIAAIERDDDYDPYEFLDGTWSELFGLTAGKLRTQPELTVEIAERLRSSVTARNLLAHHYLRDHAVMIQRPTGRRASLRILPTQRSGSSR